MKLPVAILAGGLATRLGSLTRDCPKALLPVAGRPFILHQLELLRRNGVRRVVMCVGHLGEQVEAVVRDAGLAGLDVEYSYDGPMPLGTGGAIRKAQPLLGDRFLVTYGDTLLPLDYPAVERAFVNSGMPAIMTVLRNENRWDTSNVLFRDDRIVRYDKRGHTPEMTYIDYGLGGFRADALARYAADASFDLAEVYGQLAEVGQLAAFEAHERFYEIGTPAALAETSAYIANHPIIAHPFT
jgi:NDP-sugar pyrophosphorylase family protein